MRVFEGVFVWLGRDRLLVVVVAFSIAYAIAAIAMTKSNPGLTPDATDYAETARSLVNGHGYTINRILIHTGLLEEIRHPLEMHGILRPLEIATLFLAFGESGITARIPGLLYVSALAVVVFVIARRLFGVAAGCLAAGWLLTNEQFQFVAILGGDDLGLAFWCTATIYCFLRAIEERKAHWLLVTGLVAAVATLEKLVAVFLPFTMAFVVLVLPRIREAVRARVLLSMVLPAVFAVGVYLVRNYFVHGGFGFRFTALEWLATNNPSAYFAYSPNKLSLLDVWSQMGFTRALERVFYQLSLLKVVFLLDPITLLGGFLSLLVLLRGQIVFALVSLLYSIFVLGMVCITHHLELRYLFGSYPMYIIALASISVKAVEVLAGSIPASVRRYVPIAAATLMIAWIGQRGMRIYEMLEKVGRPSGVVTPCADAVEFVRSSTDSESAILTTHPWFVTWETGRSSVMAPTNGDEAIGVIVDHYKPDWAFVGVATFGATNLESDLARLSQTNRLRSDLVYDGQQCDVYRLYRQRSK